MINAKAYVLREKGVVPELEEVQVDDKLENGQVLVRILYSGLCATQLEEIFSASRNAGYMPHLFGHEATGIVLSTGPGVKTKEIGDLCIVHWRRSSLGVDASPGRYFQGSEKLNAGPVVTFSELAVIPENRLTLLDPNIQAARGCVLGCAFPTGWGSVNRVAKVEPGQSVLVVGLGAVGLSALHTVTSLPQVTALVAESNPLRVPAQGAFKSEVIEIKLDEVHFRLQNPDVIIDTTGNPEVIERLVDLSSNRSKVVLVGMPPGGAKSSINTQKLLDGLQIFGSNGGSVDYHRDRDSVFSLFKAIGEFSELFEIITLNKKMLDQAIEIAREGSCWKVQLEF